MFLNYFIENKHLYIHVYYNYRILNMSHWWFSHTNTNTNKILHLHVAFAWCASKYLEIM